MMGINYKVPESHLPNGIKITQKHPCRDQNTSGCQSGITEWDSYIVVSSRMNIRIAARVIPLAEKEVASGYKHCVTIHEGTLTLLKEDSTLNHSFQMDNYFDESASQQQVFEGIGEPFLQWCIEGYSCSMIFVGETGSGKSFTMLGESDDKQGLIPKFVSRITSGRMYTPTVKVSIVDITSNDKVYDFLAQESHNKIKSHKPHGGYLANLTWKKVSSLQSFQEVVKLSQKNRGVLTASTNQKEGRISTLITFDLKWKDGKLSSVQFVKLAGSEYLQSLKGDDEKKHKSLQAFQSVLNQLVEKEAGRPKEINYKQSILTNTLKEALGGNCRTTVVCTVNPSSRSLQSSMITLSLGQLASNVGLKPLINELEKVEKKSDGSSSSEEKKEESCDDSE